MIFWRCEYSIRHFHVLLSLLIVLNLLQLSSNLSYLAHIGTLLFSVYWLVYAYQAQQQLPLAISYHKKYWRLTHGDYLYEGILDHGFVLGPWAYIHLVSEKHEQPEQLWLSYWQVARAESLAQGNWCQLVTMIRNTRP